MEALNKEFGSVTVEKTIIQAEGYFLVKGEKTLDVVLSTFLVMVRRYCRKLTPKEKLLDLHIPEDHIPHDKESHKEEEPAYMKGVQEGLKGGEDMDAAIGMLTKDARYLKGLELSDDQCVALINKINGLKQPSNPQTKSTLIIKICDSFGKYDLSFAGEKPLIHVLTKIGDLQGMKAILGKGANVNAKSGNGETPLHIAARTNNKDLCHLLIEHGAKLQAKDEGGQTPTAKATHKKTKDLFDPLANRAAMKGQIAPLEEVEGEPSPAQIFESMIYIQEGKKKISKEDWLGQFHELSKNESLTPLITAIAKLKKSGFKIIGSSGAYISNAVTISGRGKMAEGWAPSTKTHPRIYFSAGGTHSNQGKRGTILHESAHHMMDLIFGKPIGGEAPAPPFYHEKEKEREEAFQKIVLDVKKKFRGEEKKKDKKKEGDKSVETPESIICSVFDYPEAEWPGELIVRVPQILAAFPKEGKEWLNGHVRALFEYWTEYVLPKLNEFEPPK